MTWQNRVVERAQEIARRWGTTLEEVQSRSHDRHLRACRKAIALELRYLMGATSIEVGMALKRDRSLVTDLCGDRRGGRR